MRIASAMIVPIVTPDPATNELTLSAFAASVFAWETIFATSLHPSASGVEILIHHGNETFTLRSSRTPQGTLDMLNLGFGDRREKGNQHLEPYRREFSVTWGVETQVEVTPTREMWDAHSKEAPVINLIGVVVITTGVAFLFTLYDIASSKRMARLHEEHARLRLKSELAAVTVEAQNAKNKQTFVSMIRCAAALFLHVERSSIAVACSVADFNPRLSERSHEIRTPINAVVVRFALRAAPSPPGLRAPALSRPPSEPPRFPSPPEFIPGRRGAPQLNAPELRTGAA